MERERYRPGGQGTRTVSPALPRAQIHRTVHPGGKASVSGFDRSDVAGTVRGYLQEQLADDPDAEQVLALADELLASGELATMLAYDTEGAAP